MNKKLKKVVALSLSVMLAMSTVQINGVSSAADRSRMDDDSINLSYTAKPLGEVLQAVFAQYGRNVVFGSDVATIPISLHIEAANFEQMLYMLEIAANVEITRINESNNYSVKTFEGAQKVRDTKLAQEERAVLQEKQKGEIGLSLSSEKQRTFSETMDRLKNMQLRTFDVKFVAVEDLEKALEDVLGEDFKDIVRVKSLSTGGSRNYSSVIVNAPSKEILDRVGEIIKIIDKEKPLIEIEALFIEVAMSGQKDFGLNWNIMPNAMEYTEVPLSPNTTMGDLFDPYRLGRFVRTTAASVSAQLKTIAENGNGRVLANPRIRTMSGRKAVFASEIQEPIMSLNGDNEVRVDYKNVGVFLETLATVLDDGSIYMKVIPRSSTITGEKTLKDSTAPQISERRVETEVILHSNEIMILSGLIYERDQKTRTAVPILSSIPLLGGLFKSVSRTNERYQVLIYLRPRLVPVSSGSERGDSRDKSLDNISIQELWDKYKHEGMKAVDVAFGDIVSNDKKTKNETAAPATPVTPTVAVSSSDVPVTPAVPVAPTPPVQIDKDAAKMESVGLSRKRRYSDEAARQRYEELVKNSENDGNDKR